MMHLGGVHRESHRIMSMDYHHVVIDLMLQQQLEGENVAVVAAAAAAAAGVEEEMELPAKAEIPPQDRRLLASLSRHRRAEAGAVGCWVLVLVVVLLLISKMVSTFTAEIWLL